MDRRQQWAVEALQKAVNRCEKAGLSLAGINDNLVVFRTADFDAVSHGKAPAEVINEMDYWLVEASSYIDSGAD